MLLTQKFHSLNEIDPEFVSSLESLLHEEWPDFNAWKDAEHASPVDDTFIYWLFFGPTHNTPIGVTQVTLKKLDAGKSDGLWRKLGRLFGAKPVDQRVASWDLGGGHEGPAIFDSRFSRTGREKFTQLVQEVEAREDVMAETIFLPQGWVLPRPGWEEVHNETRTNWQSLRPFERKHKLYQDYLGNLSSESREEIQSSWKKVHREAQVTLGDYPTLTSREDLWRQCPDANQELFKELPGGLLTFQKDDQLLGAIHYQKGQHGTWFVTPMPQEPQGQEIVGDLLYVQYALLKWHEVGEARKLVVTRNKRPLRLRTGPEEQFFLNQGFTTRPVEEISWGRSPFHS